MRALARIFFDERRTDAAEREQRGLVRSAEPQGGKDRKAGLETRDFLESS